MHPFRYFSKQLLYYCTLAFKWKYSPTDSPTVTALNCCWSVAQFAKEGSEKLFPFLCRKMCMMKSGELLINS